MKFRKKPIVIEAIQFLNDASSYNLLHWINENKTKDDAIALWTNSYMVIPTLEGNHIANVGDWIIKGIKGEFYPCKREIFEMTYEEENDPPNLDAFHRRLRFTN